MKKFTSFAAFAFALCAPLAASAEDLVVAQPEGEYNNKLVWNSSCFYEYQNLAFEESINERAAEVVVNGKDFYLHNPFTKYPTNSWLKGTIDEEGNVTIPTPQLIYEEESFGRVYTYFANRMIPGYSEDESKIVYVLDQNETDIHFTYRNGILMQTDEENVMLGMTNAAGDWALYGEKDILCDPLTTSPVAPEDPSKLKLDLYMLSYHLQGTPSPGKVVQMAIDGNTMWIHDFTDIVNDSWIKGTIEGNEVTFKGGQFLGAGEGFFQYFLAGTSVKVKTDRFEYYNHSEAEDIVFTLQENGNWAAAEDASMFINIGNNGLERGTMTTMQAPVFAPYKSVDAAPATPTFLDYSQYKPTEYCGYVRFQIVPETDKKEALNPNQIYYQIFYNDQNVPETFTKEDYAQLPVDRITDIPYFFNDGTMITKSGDLFIFVFYPENLFSIGVMAYNKCESGNYNSKISWINLNNGNRYTTDATDPGVGIDGINGEDDTVEAYYNMNGMRVANPENGIYIAKMKSGKARKVMISGK